MKFACRFSNGFAVEQPRRGAAFSHKLWDVARSQRMAAVLVALLALALLASPAAAHDQTISYSTWELRGRRARVAVRLTRLDLSRFAWATGEDGVRDRALRRYLTQRLVLRAGAAACPASEPRPLSASPERVAYEWEITCPDAGALEIHSDLLLDVAPSHLHFARVHLDGAAPLERVLSESERSWPLRRPSDDAALPGASLPRYVALGIEHILTGYDHLAFLLALLLLGGSWSEVAQVVTGFTVAHSLTLGLSALGYFRPDPAPVEALIGLSIALVAAENLWLGAGRPRALRWGIGASLALIAAAAAKGHGRVPALALCGSALFAACYLALLDRAQRPVRLRSAIAFVFGLVHGFGFAGVLMEAELPRERLVPALFGFNLGVELGQLAAVAVLWPLLRWAARHRGTRAEAALVEFGSAAVLAIGVFWFVSRTYR